MPVQSLLHPFRKRNEFNFILGYYRSKTHFKHKILSFRSMTSFQSHKYYRTGVNKALVTHYVNFFQRFL